ncbi:MFS transporter [Pontibacter sp. G13]|uniref:MFS transporter n=1 Tax=Pontibacter sp. G13 TaxID=3074898 RepID=UPI0028893FCD|nr:MFS transporter [Pontibacter sp. G13]WNJ17030.1 MFS transporter [Pontibacter sp. G13]
MNSSISPRPWIMVAWLMLAYACSFMDRYLINLLVIPIQSDFELTDTQVSLLLGPSFGLFYAFMGIPMGVWADRMSRTKLIAWGIGLWSLMTAMSGLAQRYAHLFLARMGVGVGEAALSPAAYSWIASHFPESRRSSAISVYSLGIYLGAGLAYVLGGSLIAKLSEVPLVEMAGLQIRGWQWVFVCLGAPGLLLAMVFSRFKDDWTSTAPPSTLLSDFRSFLPQHRPFFIFTLGMSFYALAMYAGGVWIPTWISRVWDLPIEQTGLISGLGMVLLPAIGVIAGGMWGDHITRKYGAFGRQRLMQFMAILFAMAHLPFFWEGSSPWFLLWLIPYGLTLSMVVGMGAAHIQSLVPSTQRGMASSLYVFGQNVVGLTLGPFLVGLLSDRWFGADQLGSAIGSVGMVAAILAAGIWYWGNPAKISSKSIPVLP